MIATEMISLARKHMEARIAFGAGFPMVSSAELCLADAENAEAGGNHDIAKKRALRSLSYSIGILHPDYQLAAK